MGVSLRELGVTRYPRAIMLRLLPLLQPARKGIAGSRNISGRIFTFMWLKLMKTLIFMSSLSIQPLTEAERQGSLHVKRVIVGGNRPKIVFPL